MGEGGKEAGRESDTEGGRESDWIERQGKGKRGRDTTNAMKDGSRCMGEGLSGPQGPTPFGSNGLYSSGRQ